ncbi:HD domain-containing protein [Desulfovibrio sp. OttesenSCG-928-C14]|nr:HD domain-containing protein [Desulfovibrio sp. OttesenSCG-928-C14]
MKKLFSYSSVLICIMLVPSLALAGQEEVVQEGAETWNLMNSTFGRGSLTLVFFLIVVFLLRLLYGPKGKLRDPRWDEMNRLSRLEEAELKKLKKKAAVLAAREKRLRALVPVLEKESAALEDYVNSLKAGPEALEMFSLKKEHCGKVLENAWAMALYEGAFWPGEEAGSGRQAPGDLLDAPAGVLLLAALYHDLGRFEQFARYHTFRDAESLDHGRLGARLLASPRFLAGAGAGTRARIRLAVLLHGRAELPAGLRGARRLVCEALREADKLDILRVMAANLGPGKSPDPSVALELRDEPESYTPELLEKALQGREIRYAELRFVNDLRLLLLGWGRGLTFETSRRLLDSRGYLREVVAALPPELAEKLALTGFFGPGEPKAGF